MKTFFNPSQYAEKCNIIAEKAYRKGSNEKALEAITAKAHIEYEWNQSYRDEKSERFLVDFCKDYQNRRGSKTNQEWVRFCQQQRIAKESRLTAFYYDSFGDDTRGLSLIYLKAMSELGFHIIYVTVSSADGKQPHIDAVIKDSRSEKHYLPSSNKVMQRLDYLYELYNRNQPDICFFYSRPWDVAGAAAFMMFRPSTRFLINLTDHAYWLGLNCFDYCIEFREFGRRVSVWYRGIQKNKEVVLPYYPYIDETMVFQGWPFETAGKRIIFSGGSLYKTIDSNNTYYKMADKILYNNKDTLFVYAGYGDDSRIRILSKRYPGRVFLVGERPDLFQMMSHCNIYLNTYPFIGGLMMQYAAMAGKVPLTLRTNDEAGGILIDQDKIGVEFDTPEEVVREADHLLNDDAYAARRAEVMKKSVIASHEFTCRLNDIITSKAGIVMENDGVPSVDLSGFNLQYKKRFNRKLLALCVANRETTELTRYFPVMFIYAFIDHMVKCVRASLSRSSFHTIKKRVNYRAG